jgi:hypothetical protein
MKMKSKLVWVGLVMAALLSGCAAPLKKTAFNKESMTGLRTITITQQVDQDSFEAAVLGHPGASFGLIGGLIAAADIANKSSRLTEALQPSETRLQTRLAEQLEEQLRTAGYETVRVVLPKDAAEDQMLDLARAKQTSDAVLATQMIGAYWAAGPSTPYVPRVIARVRLLDGKTGLPLFEDTFSYGYGAPQMQTVHFAADAQFSYPDIEALTGNAAAVREGLFKGVDVIAKQVATDLRR